MPFSIPPIERGLVKRRASPRLRTAASSRTIVRFRSPTVQSTRQGSSSPVDIFPSPYDVRVTKTPNGATWEFPYGAFEVMIGGGEVHVEVKIGRFVDALILKKGKPAIG